jgi:hypothetical protein
MPPPLRLSLDPAAHAELEHRYLTTRDAETRTRYQIVLLNAQGHTHPRSPAWCGAAPTPSAGSSSATWLAGPIRCRTDRIWVSRRTTRLRGSRNWSGWPSWIPTRLVWTVRCGRVGCWPTTWLG